VYKVKTTGLTQNELTLARLSVVGCMMEGAAARVHLRQNELHFRIALHGMWRPDRPLTVRMRQLRVNYNWPVLGFWGVLGVFCLCFGVFCVFGREKVLLRLCFYN
jgi:hypothetical protein